MIQAQSQELANWHEKKKQEKKNNRHGYYIPWKEGINSTLTNASKKYSLQYYQLKVRHDAIRTYLAKIGLLRSLSVGGVTEQNKLLSTYTPNADGREKKGKSSWEPSAKIKSAAKGGVREKG